MRTIITTILLIFTAFVMAQKTDLQKEKIKGHVISMTETYYNFAFKFGEYIKEDKDKCSQTFYDENGNIYKKTTNKIEKRIFYDKITNKEDIIHYIYDKSLKLNTIITLRDKTILDKETHIEEIVKDTLQKTEYIYDANGKLIETNTYDYNLKDSSKKTLSQKVKYSYSSAKNTIDTYNGNGELSSKKIITQNGKKHTENAGGILVATEYNSIDQPLKSILYLGANNGSAASQTTYQYNKYGDILQKNSEIGLTINHKDEHHITTETYKYIYDSHQNWICRKTYKKNEMTEWIERTYTYANTSDELIEARLLNIKQEQMEAQQKHNDYHKKIEHARQIQKEKAIAQQLQDSIRHEKEKFHKLIKTVLKKNIMRISAGGGYERYKTSNCIQTIKKVFVEQQAVTFTLKDNTELPPIKLVSKEEVSTGGFMEHCTISYSADKNFILLLINGNDYLNEAGVLIHRLPHDMHQVYNLSDKAISSLKKEKNIDKINRTATNALRFINKLR